VPHGFSCAILYKVDPPVPEGVASIVGGDYEAIRGITMILNQTFYTAVFDPPLKPDDKFPTLRQGDEALPQDSRVMSCSSDGPSEKKQRLRSFGGKR